MATVQLRISNNHFYPTHWISNWNSTLYYRMFFHPSSFTLSNQRTEKQRLLSYICHPSHCPCILSSKLYVCLHVAYLAIAIRLLKISNMLKLMQNLQQKIFFSHCSWIPLIESHLTSLFPTYYYYFTCINSTLKLNIHYTADSVCQHHIQFQALNFLFALIYTLLLQIPPLPKCGSAQVDNFIWPFTNLFTSH